MTNLSPAAQAVLTAVTQQEYCLDPSEIPTEAARTGYAVAAALRAAADQAVPETKAVDSDLDYGAWEQQQRTRAEILAIADELEALPND
jgi:hypothetical protein